MTVRLTIKHSLCLLAAVFSGALLSACSPTQSQSVFPGDAGSVSQQDPDAGAHGGQGDAGAHGSSNGSSQGNTNGSTNGNSNAGSNGNTGSSGSAAGGGDPQTGQPTTPPDDGADIPYADQVDTGNEDPTGMQYISEPVQLTCGECASNTKPHFLRQSLSAEEVQNFLQTQVQKAADAGSDAHYNYEGDGVFQPDYFVLGVNGDIDGHNQAITLSAPSFDESDLLEADLVINGDFVNTPAVNIGANLVVVSYGNHITAPVNILPGGSLMANNSFASINNQGDFYMQLPSSGEAYDLVNNLGAVPEKDRGPIALMLNNTAFALTGVGPVVRGDYTQGKTGRLLLPKAMLRVNGTARLSGELGYDLIPKAKDVGLIQVVSPHPIQTDHLRVRATNQDGDQSDYAHYQSFSSYAAPVLKFKYAGETLFGLAFFPAGQKASWVHWEDVVQTLPMEKAECTVVCTDEAQDQAHTQVSAATTLADFSAALPTTQPDPKVSTSKRGSFTAPSVYFSQPIQGDAEVRYEPQLSHGQTAGIVLGDDFSATRLTVGAGAKLAFSGITVTGDVDLNNTQPQDAALTVYASGTINGNLNNQGGSLYIHSLAGTHNNNVTDIYLHNLLYNMRPDAYMILSNIGGEEYAVLSRESGLLINGNYTQNSQAHLVVGSGVLLVNGKMTLNGGTVTSEYIATKKDYYGVIAYSNQAIEADTSVSYKHFRNSDQQDTVDDEGTAVQLNQGLYALLVKIKASDVSTSDGSYGWDTGGNTDDGSSGYDNYGYTTQAVRHTADPVLKSVLNAPLKVRTQVATFADGHTQTLRLSESTPLTRLAASLMSGGMHAAAMLNSLRLPTLVQASQYNARNLRWMSGAYVSDLIKSEQHTFWNVDASTTTLMGRNDPLNVVNRLRLGIHTGAVTAHVGVAYVGSLFKGDQDAYLKNKTTSYAFSAGVKVDLPSVHNGLSVGAHAQCQKLRSHLTFDLMGDHLTPTVEGHQADVTLFAAQRFKVPGVAGLSVSPFAGYRFAQFNNEAQGFQGGGQVVQVSERHNHQNSLVGGVNAVWNFETVRVQGGANLSYRVGDANTLTVTPVGSSSYTVGADKAFAAQFRLGADLLWGPANVGLETQLFYQGEMQGGLSIHMAMNF